MATPQLEFESDVRRRIYRYVERHGSATREEVRDAVRVSEVPESKPARSGIEPSVRLPVAEFDDHVTELTDSGHLAERDGRLYVSPDAETETHMADDFEYVVRPADEDDRKAVADLVREVAAEGAIVVDERVADAVGRNPTSNRTQSDDAIESDGALVRLNERESRMFFVAEVRGEGEEDEVDGDGEIIGWVHVHGVDLLARSHTAELTVGVESAYREQGVGGTLLERGMAWADEEDCIKVYQSFPATNEAALDMLDEYGWKREATHDDHYRIDGELVDEVQMAKRLDED